MDGQRIKRFSLAKKSNELKTTRFMTTSVIASVLAITTWAKTNDVLIGIWRCVEPPLSLEVRNDGCVIMTEAGEKMKGDWHYRTNLQTVPATFEWFCGAETNRTIVKFADANTLLMMPPALHTPNEFTKNCITFIRNGPEGKPRQPTPREIEYKMINDNEQLYSRWLLQTFPYLTSIPTASVVNIEFTRYQSEQRLLPMFEYSIRGNPKDALFNIWYTIEIDKDLRPIGIKSKSVTVFDLTSRKSCLGSDGRLLNDYVGLPISESKTEETVRAIIAGKDFSELLRQARKENRNLRGREAKTDPWAIH